MVVPSVPGGSIFWHILAAWNQGVGSLQFPFRAAKRVPSKASQLANSQNICLAAPTRNTNEGRAKEGMLHRFPSASGILILNSGRVPQMKPILRGVPTKAIIRKRGDWGPNQNQPRVPLLTFVNSSYIDIIISKK